MNEVRTGLENEKVVWWNDPKIRAAIAQFFLLALVLISLYVLVRNAGENLRKIHVASGYGFLSKSAGFDIIQTLTHYTIESSYLRALYVGFLNTLLVAGLGIVFATILGFFVGIMRLSKNWIIAKVATVYVEIVRNLPLLLQILVWYGVVLKPLPNPKQAFHIGEAVYLSNRGLILPRAIFSDGIWQAVAGVLFALVAIIILNIWSHRRQDATGRSFPVFWVGGALILGLPILGLFLADWPLAFDYPVLGGFNFDPEHGTYIIPEFLALLLALVFYTATYIAEIVRSGIQAVSYGQSEAGSALGLKPATVTRLIVLPQAMRVIIPPLASQYLNLTKNSSLATVIAYPDLVATGGTILNQTGQAIEVISIWMLVYLSLSLLTSSFMNWFNSRMRLVER